MRSRGLNKKGSTSVEKVVVIIILVAFVVIAFVILSNVFHFSLLSLGKSVPTLTSQPADCGLTIINQFNTSQSCIYTLSVSDGSPGLTYTLYNNVSGKIQSYVAGASTIEWNATLTKGPTQRYYLYVCNTSGSNVSIDGSFYSAGGSADVLLPCG